MDIKELKLEEMTSQELREVNGGVAWFLIGVIIGVAWWLIENR